MGADTGFSLGGSSGLSEEQAAVYDRQLRVWGVEAQQRMAGAIAVLARVPARHNRHRMPCEVRNEGSKRVV